MKSLVNICIMLHYDFDADPELIQKSAKLALKRNVSSTTRLCKTKDKKIMQYFYDGEPDEIKTVDFTGETPEELEIVLDKESKKPDGKYGIYFCVSHLAFDAYALMEMASDMLYIYRCLRDGEELREYKCDPISLIAKEKEYLTSPKRKEDADYFIEEAKKDGGATYTSINGKSKAQLKKGKKYGTMVNVFAPQSRHVNKLIPKEIANAINDRALENKVSPQVYHLLAWRAALSKACENETDIMIGSTVNRRATLAEKRSGGTRVGNIDIRMNFPNDMSIEDAVAAMKKKQEDAYRHSEAIYSDISKVYSQICGCNQTEGYETVNLTYQPVTVRSTPDMPVHMTRYSNGACMMMCYVTIMALDNSGDLVCNIEDKYKVNKPGVLDAAYNTMYSALCKLAKGEAKTLGDLIK